IASQPQSRTNSAGATATFTVKATGSAALKYQWQFNGSDLTNAVDVSGATSNVLSLANVQLADSGSYAVVVTNAFGNVISLPATLSVVTPGPILLTSAALTNDTLRFSFTNTPGATFTVLAATTLAQPLNTWTPIGGISEVS